MFTIKFLKADGTSAIFNMIDKVSVGSTYSQLENIDSENILSYTFPVKGLYQLTGENINVTYYADESVSSVIITKN